MVDVNLKILEIIPFPLSGHLNGKALRHGFYVWFSMSFHLEQGLSEILS